MCTALRLPDLTRKPMLLKFFNSDDTLHLPLLVQAFDAAKHDDHGVAALMIIWARLCVDEGYRCHVFDDWLKFLVISHAIDWRRCDCCIVAGLHLVTIILSTFLEDLSWRIVDDVLPTLLETLAHTKDDNLVHELCLRIIDRLASAIYCDLKTEGSALEFMRTLVQHVPRMHYPAAVKVIMRSLIICTVALYTQKDSSIAHHDELLIDLFVGLLRFGYPRSRRLALRWLANSIKDMSDRPWRPGYFLSAQKRVGALPAPLRAQMEEYGWESCDSVRLARCIEGFCDAFTGFTIKRDLRSLALRLFCIITEDPRCVRFDDFFARRTGIGKRQPRHYGVDCDTWPEILDHCSLAVRDVSRRDLLAAIPEHILRSRTALDVSDVFTLTRAISARDRTKLADTARSIMRRSSCEPFLSYAIAMVTSKMLEKSRIRDFYDSDHAAYHHALAQNIMSGFYPLIINADGIALGDGGVWADVARSAFSLRDLCLEYLDAAPPDACERCSVLEVYIAIRLFIWGPDEPETLSDELKDTIEEWRVAVTLNEKLWGGYFRHEIGGLGELILDRLIPASKMWRQPLRRIFASDEQHDAEEDFEADFDPPGERTFSKAELLHWQRRVFAPLEGDPPLDWSEMPRKVLESFAHPKLRPFDVHECASCKIRTILVRRCGRCRAQWYCEPECQLKDWGEHKLTCVPYVRRRGGAFPTHNAS
ncbi:hypothetical protein EXIGLDRAFT_829463 [Exidia glandulosa HHB12029]|uniref:MYND-type domain-containing protein n=1 Tax=Exidia glandulosa HHB12029 TaxID=1314781 RepID=A0A165PJM3_EXIGL|nr:hypothetical protein EXIGLDRAFT_829463 [Exidia glandulosa HHB12029]